MFAEEAEGTTFLFASSSWLSILVLRPFGPGDSSAFRPYFIVGATAVTVDGDGFVNPSRSFRQDQGCMVTGSHGLLSDEYRQGRDLEGQYR